MVVHACNPSTQEADAGVRASLGYMHSKTLRTQGDRDIDRKTGNVKLWGPAPADYI
jgi:hypothetical protein